LADGFDPLRLAMIVSGSHIGADDDLVDRSIEFEMNKEQR